MKSLNSFKVFDWNAFAKDKDFTVTGMSEWQDFHTKDHLGKKIEVIITRDDTVYPTKQGDVQSNLYEKFTIKVSKDVDVSAGEKIVPVNPVAKGYGRTKDGNFSDFWTLLSVTCDDIEII